MNRTIAALTYTVLRTYRMALGESGGPTWEAAPQALKLKCTLAVDWIRDQKTEPTAADLHKRWVSQKLIDGWSHGPRSATLKTHPYVGVSFDGLPREQRAKGDLALALVRALAPLALATDKAEAFAKRVAHEAETEQHGALLFIAAMVRRFGGETGIVQLSDADMQAALELELSRHDTEDGGLILKVETPAPAEAGRGLSTLN